MTGSHTPGSGSHGSIPPAVTAGSSSTNSDSIQPSSPPPDPPLGSPRALNGSIDHLGIDLLADLASVESNVQQSVWAGRTRQSYQPPTVEDADDNDNDNNDIQEGGAAPDGQDSDEERLFWERIHTEERETSEYEAISVWDELAESFIREGFISGAHQLHCDIAFFLTYVC